MTLHRRNVPSAVRCTQRWDELTNKLGNSRRNDAHEAVRRCELCKRQVTKPLVLVLERQRSEAKRFLRGLPQGTCVAYLRSKRSPTLCRPPKKTCLSSSQRLSYSEDVLSLGASLAPAESGSGRRSPKKTTSRKRRRNLSSRPVRPRNTNRKTQNWTARRSVSLLPSATF